MLTVKLSAIKAVDSANTIQAQQATWFLSLKK